jgi:hypothetical protein
MIVFLRFPDEATARLVLADFYDADYGWKTASLVHALDPIGTLYTDAAFDANGNITAPATPLAGWHVNFIGELPEAAQAYAIEPMSPRVVFAT